MNKTLQIPAWAVTLGSLLLTLGSLGAGVVSAGWAARGVLEKQTQAITSLRQTINETVKPALAEAKTHGAQLGAHETRLAVIESSCCDRPPVSTPKPAAPGPLGDASQSQPALTSSPSRPLRREGVL